MFGGLVAFAEAEWDFDADARAPESDGPTRSTRSRSAAGSSALIVRLFWARYMKKVLPGLIAEVDRWRRPR